MKIQIIRPAALGDTLMLMPSLRALRQGVETTLVGRRPGIDFLAPYVHRVMDYESQGWHTLFMDQEETVSSISLPSADLVALFHADPEGRIAARLQRLLPGSRLRVFPGFPPADEETHVALYLADCLETSGCPIKPEQAFEAALRSPLLRQANVGEVFHPSRANKEEGRAVFHPGSGGRRKNLPPRFWLDFIRCFRGSSSLPLTLLLGPAEEELLSFFRARLHRTETEILFCPEKENLMSLLSQSRLYAGHDSGITHLAAMLGAPTLAFFTSTSVIQWRPLGPKVRIIEGEGSGPDMLEQAVALAFELVKEAC
jgi:heptosyltransferase III